METLFFAPFRFPLTALLLRNSSAAESLGVGLCIVCRQVGGGGWRVCEGEREIHDFRVFPKCLKVCAHCLCYKKPVMLLTASIRLLCPAGAHSLFGSLRREIRPVQTLIQNQKPDT